MGQAGAVLDPIEIWKTLKKIKGESFTELFLLVELCLCSPFSNATIERFFSHMSIVKTDWRNKLNEQSLEDSLRIHLAGPDLMTFSESYVAKTVTAWYNDKPRRAHQRKRKKYKQRTSVSSKRSNADHGLNLADVAASALVATLTTLYSRSTKDGNVYSDWKSARLCPTFKEDDEKERGNYRPISLLSIPSKILESCIADSGSCFLQEINSSQIIGGLSVGTFS